MSSLGAGAELTLVLPVVLVNRGVALAQSPTSLPVSFFSVEDGSSLSSAASRRSLSPNSDFRLGRAPDDGRAETFVAGLDVGTARDELAGSE